MDIFDDPEIAALLEEATADAEEITLPKGVKATTAAIEYAKSLVERVGYDMTEYNWDEMEQSEASEIIDDCKAELGIE